MHTSGKDTLTITSLAVAIKFQNIWFGTPAQNRVAPLRQLTDTLFQKEINQFLLDILTSDFSRSYSESKCDLVILVILLCDTKT